MRRLHIECNGCKKDIAQALWIADPIMFTRTPYCTECYQRIKDESGK